MYTRVIPRDLFNEAKLLKCLGQLSLIIHNGVDEAYFSVPSGLTLEHELGMGPHESGFLIDQHESSGDIYCTNLFLRADGETIRVHSSLNSKEPYPLCFEDDEGGEGSVFDNDGTFSVEFIDFLESKV